MNAGHHHENPNAGQGSVLLDIGGDVGALVVSMPPSTGGAEIEIAPAGLGDGHRPHVAVVDRPVTGGTMPSLVFPDLVEGAYELYDKGGEQVLLTARVNGGEVTFLDWDGGIPV